jgi:hypothetical protein
VLTDDNKWSNSEFNKEHIALVDKHNDLIDRYNKLVGAFNRNIASVNPVGRPIAASEAQQEQIIRHHKRGQSARWIAEEMTLSRRTVTTIIGKLDGSDRTSNLHRRRLGLEPKRKDWRPAAMARLPKQAAKHLEKGRGAAQGGEGAEVGAPRREAPTGIRWKSPRSLTAQRLGVVQSGRSHGTPRRMPRQAARSPRRRICRASLFPPLESSTRGFPGASPLARR